MTGEAADYVSTAFWSPALFCKERAKQNAGVVLVKDDVKMEIDDAIL